jgi:hypothetical protein
VASPPLLDPCGEGTLHGSKVSSTWIGTQSGPALKGFLSIENIVFVWHVHTLYHVYVCVRARSLSCRKRGGQLKKKKSSFVNFFLILYLSFSPNLTYLEEKHGVEMTMVTYSLFSTHIHH